MSLLGGAVLHDRRAWLRSCSAVGALRELFEHRPELIPIRERGIMLGLGQAALELGDAAIVVAAITLRARAPMGAQVGRGACNVAVP